MRSLITIVAVVLVAIVSLRIGAMITNRAPAEGAPSSTTSRTADLSTGSPESTAAEQMNDQAKLLEQRTDLETQQQTAPLDQAADRMQSEQQVIQKQKELTKEQIATPYELELKRIEEEKKLLRAQIELKQLQEKAASDEIKDAPQIKPLDLRNINNQRH